MEYRREHVGHVIPEGPSRDPAAAGAELVVAGMQAGIGPLGVFLLAHGWESGVVGSVMTIGGVAGLQPRPDAVQHLHWIDTPAVSAPVSGGRAVDAVAHRVEDGAWVPTGRQPCNRAWAANLPIPAERPETLTIHAAIPSYVPTDRMGRAATPPPWAHGRRTASFAPTRPRPVGQAVLPTLSLPFPPEALRLTQIQLWTWGIAALSTA